MNPKGVNYKRILLSGLHRRRYVDHSLNTYDRVTILESLVVASNEYIKKISKSSIAAREKTITPKFIIYPVKSNNTQRTDRPTNYY